MSGEITSTYIVRTVWCGYRTFSAPRVLSSLYNDYTKTLLEARHHACTTVPSRSSHVRYRVGSHSGCVHTVLVNSATIICATTSALKRTQGKKRKERSHVTSSRRHEKSDLPSKRTGHTMPRIPSGDKLARVPPATGPSHYGKFVNRSDLWVSSSVRRRVSIPSNMWTIRRTNGSSIAV